MNIPKTVFSPENKELKLIVDLLQNSNDLDINEISWDRFILLVQEHRLIQTIYPLLIEKKLYIPFHTLDLLKNDYLQSKFILLNFANESVELSKALQKKGIESIFFKGVMQGYRYTGDFTKRHCRDIDVMVHEKDLEETGKVLESMNYKLITNIGYTPKQKAAYKAFIYHIEYFNEEKNTLIELHWKLHLLSESLSHTEQGIWQRSTAITENEASIKLLSPVDNFIQLALHGTKHGWFRLHWLYDIKQVLLGENEKFIEEIMLAASKLNVQKQIITSIMLADLVFKLPMDLSKYKNIAHNKYKLIITFFLENIERTPVTGNKKSFLYFQIENIRALSFRNKLHALKNLMLFYFTKADNWEIFYFPDKVFFLNYLAAPFILIYRNIAKK